MNIKDNVENYIPSINNNNNKLKINGKLNVDEI